MNFKQKKYLSKAFSLILVIMLFTTVVFNINHVEANAKGSRSSSKSSSKSHSSKSRVNVKGYYRKDGTYVRPHVRTYPDSSLYNNLSRDERLDPISSYEPVTNHQVKNDKIKSLKRSGKLSVSNSNIKNKHISSSSRNYITLGSTKDDVRRIQGDPTNMVDTGIPHWVYKDSYIYFNNEGKVINWDNNGDLNIFICDQTNAMDDINKGDSMEKVLSIMGTPDKFKMVASLYILVYEFEETPIYICFNADGQVEFVA